MPDDYITVRVPESMRKLFQKIDKEYGLGYTSFAEFVKEAIRLRAEELIDIYQESD